MAVRESAPFEIIFTISDLNAVFLLDGFYLVQNFHKSNIKMNLEHATEENVRFERIYLKAEDKSHFIF